MLKMNSKTLKMNNKITIIVFFQQLSIIITLLFRFCPLQLCCATIIILTIIITNNKYRSFYITVKGGL